MAGSGTDWKCYFCGGKSCKYEPAQWKRWTKRSECPNAITGLYSNFVTDSILAMARPSRRAMEEHHIVEQFRKHGIDAVINCQQPYEHGRCGEGNLESGFSYLPEDFMRAGIAHYNFCWKDMTAPRNGFMLQIVQVMAYFIDRGRKISVHCHAGRGRTGLCIAAYLVYSDPRMQPMDAILAVRKRRPGSVQTSKQVAFIEAFHAYLADLRRVFLPQLTLKRHLRRQSELLHGFEKRKLAHTPKIMAVGVERIVTLVQMKDETGDTGPRGVAHAIGRLAENAAAAKDRALVSAVDALCEAIDQSKWSAVRKAPAEVVVMAMRRFLTNLATPLLPEAVAEALAGDPKHMEKHLDVLSDAEAVTLLSVVQVARAVSSPAVTAKELDAVLRFFVPALVGPANVAVNDIVAALQHAVARWKLKVKRALTAYKLLGDHADPDVPPTPPVVSLADFPHDEYNNLLPAADEKRAARGGDGADEGDDDETQDPEESRYLFDDTEDESFGSDYSMPTDDDEDNDADEKGNDDDDDGSGGPGPTHPTASGEW